MKVELDAELSRFPCQNLKTHILYRKNAKLKSHDSFSSFDDDNVEEKISDVKYAWRIGFRMSEGEKEGEEWGKVSE